MKAIMYQQYGAPEVLNLQDAPKPTPGDNEVLVKVCATTVTSGDYRARSLDLPPGFGFIGRLVFGVRRPRRAILGTEFSGIVEAIGKNVRRFAVGDPVFAYPGGGFGGYGEYCVLGEDKAIAPKPAALSFEAAAAISFGGATALNFLKDKGGIKEGDKVLISGASGGVGVAAVQLAKYFGAHVTGVCSTPNLDLVTSFGADEVIDYTVTDFAQHEETYDIILDTTGTVTYDRAKSALKVNGRLLLVSADLFQLLAMIVTPKRGGRKGLGGYAPERAEDLQFLAALAETGDFKPYIDRRYTSDQVAEAHAYVGTGRKRGNVAIMMASCDVV